MFKKFETSTLVVLFIFAAYCTIITGSYWDEIYEMNIGKDRLKYLFSLGSYNYFDFHIYTEFYPGFYNTLAVFITKFFPLKFENEIWRLTHLFFCILLIFGISKIATNLFNKKVGKIVFILCFFYPIFFGHMIMNSKDTIVAFAHVWSTYLFLKYIQEQNINKKRNRYVIFAGLTVGLGMGVRFPFLVTLLPLFFFIVIEKFISKKIICENFSFNKFIFDLLKIFVIAYLIAISFWPQVHANIFLNPFTLTLKHLTVEGGGVPWILFNGNIFSTSNLPYTYITTNLFYKSPEFFLLCYVLSIILIFSKKEFFLTSFNHFFLKIFLILLILGFPIIYFIFLPYRVYDGLRLFLFILPYFCIIPGIVVYYLMENFKNKFIKFISFVTFILFIYYSYVFISLTPYQYTYLNRFAGSFSTAYEKFENDYFATSSKELVNNMSSNNNLFNSNKKYKISFCGVNHKIVINELNKLKNFEYEIKDLRENDFDFVIMTNRSQGDGSSNLSNVKSCFKKFAGEDLINVKRNGLLLSTLRKKL